MTMASSPPEAPLQEIYSLLVPLAENRLLVPRANIAEVTGYREPEPYSGSLPWLLGSIGWAGERIPVLSFEGASGGVIPKVAPVKPSDSEADAGMGGDPRGISAAGHTAIVSDFLDALRDNRSPPIDGREGRRSLAAVLAIYEAAGLA